MTPTTASVLLIIETGGLVASIITLGIGFYVYRKLNQELQYARQKAEKARDSLKTFLESCAAALDPEV